MLKLHALLVSAFFSFLYPFLLNAQPAGRQPAAKYVILISMDGLRPDFYLEDRWPVSNLRALKVQGSYAEGVNSVFPTVTYPSHTTLITGATPVKHGVYYNTMFSDTGSTSTWYREEKLIRTVTLWDAVRKAGLKSAVISWPVSVGAPVDYNFPELWQDDLKGSRPVNAHVYPEGLLQEVEREATGRLSFDEMTLDNLQIDGNLGRIAAYLIRTYKPNFTTLHLLGIDHAEHDQGRSGPLVDQALAVADNAISDVLQALDAAGIRDSTAIIVTGDHGFTNVHTQLAPNVLLRQQQLIGDNGNWKAMFHSAGGSAFLHLNDPKDTRTLRSVRSLLDSLPAAHRKLFRVIEKDQLTLIGADPRAVLAITATEGITFSGVSTGEFLRSGKGGTHGSYPDAKHIQTGFVIWGAGVKPGQVIPEMGLADVSPLIASLLGLDFTAPDGVLYPGLLQQAPAMVKPVVNGNITPK